MHAATHTPLLISQTRDAPNYDMSQPHFLLITYPLPGHINPTLHFADRLSRTGACVTFFTTVYAHRRMIKSAPSPSLSYATFSDGYDDGPCISPGDATRSQQFKKRCPEALAQQLRTLADGGSPVTCVIYTLLLPWAADVARAHHIPHVLLWIQPAAVFFAYYHYFHGHRDLILSGIEKDPSCSVNLPGLPPLAPRDFPSFILPSDPYKDVISAFKEQFEEIDREKRARVLVNTFEEAEPETVTGVVDGVEMVCVGPLVPPAFFDGREATSATDGGEVYKADSKPCMAWLDSQAEGSVVYVSFGSIIALQEEQMAEILKGLLESGRPFLWVLRTGGEEGSGKDGETGFWEKARAAEERGEGMVVGWCSQLAVLSHASVGSFVSHCGWNSTTESLAAGVPMVCLPRWSDQTTNAKLVVDVWKAGARGEANEKGIFEGGEVKRCLDLAMGEEIRKNALRWRDMAREAGAQGGLGDRNIRAFVEEMRSAAATNRNSCCNGDVRNS
ncbi:hypothetical protein ACLOJK_022702 [Asimina triloba]